MPNAPSKKVVTLSVRVYQRLLAAYPAKYRREYGALMAQLFRDQCRDAYDADGSVGLIKLWFRTLPDLIRTAIKERRMPAPASARVALIMRKDSMRIPLFTFRGCLVMIAPLLLIVVGSIAYTLNLTPVYCSMVRIVVERADNGTTQYDPYFLQTQFEILQSNRVLDQVIQELGLERVWGERFGASATQRLLDARNLLKKSLLIRQSRNTSLIEIRVFDEQPQGAAEIANEIAKVYCRQVASSGQHARVIDMAEPALRPMRPNVPMNLSVGLVLGLVAGGLAFIVDRRLRTRSHGDGPSGRVPLLQHG